MLKYNAKAIDPDVDPLSYSLVLAPQGMTVDTQLGIVIWNPSKSAIAEYYAQLEADLIRVGKGKASAIAKTPNVAANAPVVSFQLFGIDDVISSLSDIKRLVDDPDDNLQSYAVDIAAIGTDDWTTIITGNSEVNAGGVLGKFDPSIAADDSYRIRLTATDTTGLSSSVEDQVNVVSGGLKLGNFTLSFTDLSIPISGIPINVTRTYDSLNPKTKDDFGYGWRLEFRDTDLRTSLGKDTVYEQTGLRTQAFKDGTKVFITLPGGKRETFTFKPTRDPISNYLPSVGDFDTAIYHPAFSSEKGSTNTLSVVDTRLSNVNGKYYSLGSGGVIKSEMGAIKEGRMYDRQQF